MVAAENGMVLNFYEYLGTRRASGAYKLWEAPGVEPLFLFFFFHLIRAGWFVCSFAWGLILAGCM